MIKRLILGAIALLLFFPALARAQSTITIGVVGQSSVANTAAYGTIVDALVASNSSSRIQGVTWSISGNSNFYVDLFGDLHTAWNSIISPGPQNRDHHGIGAGIHDGKPTIDGNGDRHFGPTDDADHILSSCNGI